MRDYYKIKHQDMDKLAQLLDYIKDGIEWYKTNDGGDPQQDLADIYDRLDDIIHHTVKYTAYGE